MACTLWLIDPDTSQKNTSVFKDEAKKRAKHDTFARSQTF